MKTVTDNRDNLFIMSHARRSGGKSREVQVQRLPEGDDIS